MSDLEIAQQIDRCAQLNSMSVEQQHSQHACLVIVAACNLLAIVYMCRVACTCHAGCQLCIWPPMRLLTSAITPTSLFAGCCMLHAPQDAACVVLHPCMQQSMIIDVLHEDQRISSHINLHVVLLLVAACGLAVLLLQSRCTAIAAGGFSVLSR
jgi:hypothetical protein